MKITKGGETVGMDLGDYLGVWCEEYRQQKQNQARRHKDKKIRQSKE